MASGKTPQSKKTFYDIGVVKRTSAGGKWKPKNKHARKNWKAYRGQGR